MSKEEDGFKDFVLDQLVELQGLTSRAMFGGYGLYLHGMFFGIIHKSRLYFKTNSNTAPHYRKHGMTPFAPGPKQILKNYYEVPVDVVESSDDLAAWARQAARPK